MSSLWLVSAGGLRCLSKVRGAGICRLAHSSVQHFGVTLRLRCVTWSPRASLHTTPRRASVHLLVPKDFEEALKAFDEPMAKCKNERELWKRGELLMSEYTEPYYRRTAVLCAKTGRPRLHWYRDDAVQWANEATKLNDAHWKDCHVNEHSDQQRQKVLEVLHQLRSAQANREVMQHDRAEYNVKLLDTRKKKTGDFTSVSYPNGTIYISRDYVKTLSQNKLAFVLAREMAHVYQCHVSELWSLRVLCSLLSHYTAETLRHSVHYQSWQDDLDTMVEAVHRVKSHYVEQLIKPGRMLPGDTVMALEADKLALKLSKGANFDPTSARKLMKKRDQLYKGGQLDCDETANWKAPLWDHIHDVIKDLYNREPGREFKECEDPIELNKKCVWLPRSPSHAERLTHMDKIMETEILQPAPTPPMDGPGSPPRVRHSTTLSREESIHQEKLEHQRNLEKERYRRRVVGWGDRMSFMMGDAEGFKLFGKFLTDNSQKNTYLFLKAIQPNTDIDDDPDRRKQRRSDCIEIYRQYLSPDLATHPLDLVDSSAVKEVEHNIDLDLDFTEAQIFEAPRKQIIRALRAELYPKFIHSDLYKQVVEEAGPEIHLQEDASYETPWQKERRATELSQQAQYEAGFQHVDMKRKQNLDRVKNWIFLQVLLADKEGYQLFEQFLQGEGKKYHDQLLFWTAVNEYKDMKNIEEKKERAAEIWQQYLGPEATHRVEVVDEMAVSDARKYLDNYRVNAFHHAFRQVFKRPLDLPYNEIHEKFLNSEIYQQKIDEFQELPRTPYRYQGYVPRRYSPKEDPMI